MRRLKSRSLPETGIKVIRVILLSVLMVHHLSAQETTQFPVSEVFSGQTIEEAFDILENNYPVRFFYPENQIPDKRVSLEFRNTPVLAVVEKIIEGTDLGFMTYGRADIIIGDKSVIGQEFSTEYYQAMEEKPVVPEADSRQSYIVGSKGSANPGGYARLILEVVALDDKEPIPGAHVFHKKSGEEAITDRSGHAVITIPIGHSDLQVRSLGFEDLETRIGVYEDGRINLKMHTKTHALEEVVIVGNESDVLRSPDIGALRIDLESIKRLPAFLGEADVIKSLQMLPGVTTVGEGSGGFNVRGGNADHNLVMLNEAPLYNYSHLFGFYSTLNHDLIEKSTFYKGFIPPRYGGRLSSVLSIKSRFGNDQEHIVQGSLGVVGSGLILEGPLKKGASSYLLGGRFTYADALLKLINNPDVQSSATSFYDFNGHFSQKIGEHSQVGFSTYFSKDDVTFANNFGFDYQTAIAQANADLSLTDKLSTQLWLIYTDYNARLKDIADLSNASIFANGINTLKVKKEFLFVPQKSFQLSLGSEFAGHLIDVGQLKPLGMSSAVEAKELQPERSREFTGFVNGTYELSQALSLISGLRYTTFRNVGPGEVFIYKNEHLDASMITDTLAYGKGDRIASYSGWEPRLSLNWMVSSKTSVKAGYSRVYQYLFQLSNTAGVSPVDLWQLSNTHFQPQRAHNFSIGYYSKVKYGLQLSFETYYRAIDHMVDYKPFASLLGNGHLETETVSGIGRAFGLEFGLSRSEGKINGSLAYTYSRSERRAGNNFSGAEISNGQWYPSNADRPHILTLNINYDWTKRNRLALNFNYSSGRPTTAPIGFYKIDNNLSVPVYSLRNSQRIPAYHRLDLSYSILPGYKKDKAIKGTWTFSIYNLYGRKNAYSVFFTQSFLSQVNARKFSVLGSAFPAITYTFKIAGNKNQ